MARTPSGFIGWPPGTQRGRRGFSRIISGVGVQAGLIALVRNEGRALPAALGARHGDRIAQRLAGLGHQIQPAVAERDDDLAGFVLAGRNRSWCGRRRDPHRRPTGNPRPWALAFWGVSRPATPAPRRRQSLWIRTWLRRVIGGCSLFEACRKPWGRSGETYILHDDSERRVYTSPIVAGRAGKTHCCHDYPSGLSFFLSPQADVFSGNCASAMTPSLCRSSSPSSRVLPEKWEPVFRKEARRNKELGSGRDSFKNGQTLALTILFLMCSFFIDADHVKNVEQKKNAECGALCFSPFVARRLTWNRRLTPPFPCCPRVGLVWPALIPPGPAGTADLPSAVPEFCSARCACSARRSARGFAGQYSRHRASVLGRGRDKTAAQGAPLWRLGCPRADALLPLGGLETDSVHEVKAAVSGRGASGCGASAGDWMASLGFALAGLQPSSCRAGKSCRAPSHAGVVLAARSCRRVGSPIRPGSGAVGARSRRPADRRDGARGGGDAGAGGRFEVRFACSGNRRCEIRRDQSRAPLEPRRRRAQDALSPAHASRVRGRGVERDPLAHRPGAKRAPSLRRPGAGCHALFRCPRTLPGAAAKRKPFPFARGVV